MIEPSFNEERLDFNPLVHGRFSRPIIHGGGGGAVRPSPHNPYYKWYQTIPLCTDSLSMKFLEKFSVLRVLN